MVGINILNLPVVGITALFIASKINEVPPPDLSTFAKMTIRACTTREILEKEDGRAE